VPGLAAVQPGLIKKMVPWFKTIGGGAALFAAQMTLA